MKRLNYLLACGTALLLTVSSQAIADDLKVGVVNFKTCLEQSKIGKQEQASFEAMKKQMEAILEEKGKVMESLEAKAKDADYMDSLSPEAEGEFHKKGRELRQELMQLQNQYMQTLNQANFKIVQKLNELISHASKEIASEKKLDLILNEEGCFYYGPRLDISNVVSTKMDELSDKQEKANKPKAGGQQF